MLNNVLEIVLVTYNRCAKLKRTMAQLLAETSPVRNIDITVVDNCSTDGTSEYLASLTVSYPNIRHIRRRRNVGANANIAFAYEIARKKYLWVLCDDDKYDFDAWDNVVDAINNDQDMILVSKYALPRQKRKIDTLALLSQATFVPATIIKTECLDDTTLRNIYDSIFTMYVQLIPIITMLNDGKKFFIPAGHAVVRNGMDYGKKLESGLDGCENYCRGANSEKMYYRSAHMSQFIGFANVLSLLKDEEVKNKHLNVFIKSSKPVLRNTLKDIRDRIYFADIYSQLSQKQRLRFWWNYIRPGKFYKWIFQVDHVKKNGRVTKDKYVTFFGKRFVIKEKQ